MERAGYRWYREWVGEKQAFIDNELKEAVEFRKVKNNKILFFSRPEPVHCF